MLEQYAMLFDVEIFLKLINSVIFILSGFIYSFFKNCSFFRVAPNSAAD